MFSRTEINNIDGILFQINQFLKRCLKHYPLDKPPKTLNTDKHSSYAHAISGLKKKRYLRKDVKQRPVKYLNNGIESDHSPIKKLITATSGFKIQKRAWPTIQGFESVRMLNKGCLPVIMSHL